MSIEFDLPDFDFPDDLSLSALPVGPAPSVKAQNLPAAEEAPSLTGFDLETPGFDMTPGFVLPPDIDLSAPDFGADLLLPSDPVPQLQSFPPAPLSVAPLPDFDLATPDEFSFPAADPADVAVEARRLGDNKAASRSVVDANPAEAAEANRAAEEASSLTGFDLETPGFDMTPGFVLPPDIDLSAPDFGADLLLPSDPVPQLQSFPPAPLSVAPLPDFDLATPDEFSFPAADPADVAVEARRLGDADVAVAVEEEAEAIKPGVLTIIMKDSAAPTGSNSVLTTPAQVQIPSITDVQSTNATNSPDVVISLPASLPSFSRAHQKLTQPDEEDHDDGLIQPGAEQGDQCADVCKVDCVLS